MPRPDRRHRQRVRELVAHPGAGHSCVNVACQSPSCARERRRCSGRCLGSWLKASSTRNELSVISKGASFRSARLAARAGCAIADSREPQERDDDRHRLHEHLRRGARADGDARDRFAAQPHAVGGGVALLDLDDRARLQVVPLDEAQELRILIGDAADRDRLARADSSGACRAAGARARPPGRGSDRRADRPRAARASRRCDRSADPDTACSRCSASSCTSVQLMPITFTRNSSISRWRRSDERGQLLARRGQPHAAHRARIAPAPTRPASSPSSSAVPGRRPSAGGELPHRDQVALARQVRFAPENGLEVVFDGGGGQRHLTSIAQFSILITQN